MFDALNEAIAALSDDESMLMGNLEQHLQHTQNVLEAFAELPPAGNSGVRQSFRAQVAQLILAHQQELMHAITDAALGADYERRHAVQGPRVQTAPASSAIRPLR